MLGFLPDQILCFALFNTTRGWVHRFTTRVCTTIVIKVGITLPYYQMIDYLREISERGNNNKKKNKSSYSTSNKFQCIILISWRYICITFEIYLWSHNTILNKVLPCLIGIPTITAITTHNTTAWEEIIDRKFNTLKQMTYIHIVIYILCCRLKCSHKWFNIFNQKYQTYDVKVDAETIG